MARSSQWSQVDKLIEEAKFEEAQKLVVKIREQAQKSDNGEEWTEALIKEVQFMTAQHGYESAVRFLREQSWPQDFLSQTSLELFFAQSLMNYLSAYSWEISKREKVESKGAIDLKSWTKEQIYLEAQKAYGRLWAMREQLGDQRVAVLAPLVSPNNYPESIRGTLRDTLSYLAVALFANTQGWTPAQSNDVFRLDLKRLLSPDAKAHDLKLDDPAAHPVEKLVAVLIDLERWHAQGTRREASLEARLELIERLHESFTDKADRALLRAHLEEVLNKHRDLPWWAKGQAQLAQMVRNGEGDLVHARELALTGYNAFPSTVGGKRCLNIVRAIEQPHFLLNGVLTDATKKRSIQVRHKSLKALYFRAYAYDLRQHINGSTDYNLLPSYREMKEMLARKPAFEWTTELPATPDYKEHATYVTPPMQQLGAYMVLASTSPSFKEEKNRTLGVNLILSDLVMVTRQQGPELEVTVVSGTTGQPVSGAEVTLYEQNYNRRHAPDKTVRTDAKGQARFSKRGDRGYFVLAENGADVALDPQTVYLSREYDGGKERAALIFTDRSIYRPQQKIAWKIVAYEGKAQSASYKVAAGASIQVRLLDPNGEAVATQDVKTNDFGTAAGEFVPPAGRLLGSWHIDTVSYSGSAVVKVEEYKRPTFEVALKDPTAALRLNKPATLTGEARYYFGLPVTAGAVKWRVKRNAVYPWWWHFWGMSSGRGDEQTIATGTSQLQPDGTFQITFTPEADERKGKQVTYSYAVSADLTDEGGETRSATRSFRLGFVSVEASVRMDTGFLLAGAPAQQGKQKEASALTIKRTSLDGIGRAGEGSYRILRIAPKTAPTSPAELPVHEPPVPEEGAKAAFKTPGDRQRPRGAVQYNPQAELASWPDGAEQAHGKLSHNDKGEARLALPALPAGAYRVRYETLDEFGAKAETFYDFHVADGHTATQLPLALLLERGEVRVGETARLLVSSGMPAQTLFLDIYRDSKLIERRMLDASRESLVELPMKEEDRGGLGIVAWAVRDHQYLTLQSAVHVPWDNKELKIAFSTFRDKLRPGAKETWRVNVKGPDGAALGKGMVELLSYMFDRSLELFAPHHPPSPLSLYPQRSGTGYVRTNAHAVSPLWLHNNALGDIPAWPDLHADQIHFYDNYGVGGPGSRNIRVQASGLMMERSRRADAPGAPPPPAPPPPPRASAPAQPKEAREEKAGNGRANREAESFNGQDEAHGGEGKRGPGKDAAGGEGPQLRSNFAETAYFIPQLLTEKDGSATIEFSIPDSVTSWSVWVHAITKDLKGGSLRQEARTVKELMVRPYLPRFFREADSADLKVVVNNAGDKALAGTLNLEILDPQSHESRIALFQVRSAKQPFRVEPGKSAALTFPLSAPREVGTYAFKVTATAGDIGDGELRPLPVLPSRMHLMQSRFVTLRDRDSRTMTFEDLKKNDDPSRINEQLVVTLDTQLFFTVLKALPYLVTYPYECVEQTMNRFLSTGIASSMYAQYPAVAKMAKEFSQRKTQLEPWDANDPNRKMTLEESPWLQTSRGGKNDTDRPLINVLDPQIAKAQRDSALAKLQKAQTSSGGFPWFPGGPPSPFMTLYLINGFARATEFQIEIPRDMVHKGWQYLARHFREDYIKCMKEEKCGVEFLTLLNYAASSFPDSSWTGDALTPAERTQILDYCFKRWKSVSPYLKGLLALTLKRMGRPEDARLVWASVMDSAKTLPDQGTFWAQEDRSWLWYNDTIESHAFALRVLMELDPQNPKKDGLVLWLLLNKKLSQWKSTRATAEVIYSLVHYLKQDKSLGVREEATVRIGPESKHFTFEPDQYVGKTQIVVPGAQVDPVRSSTITVEKPTKGFMFASAAWHFSTDRLPTEGSGDFFQIGRTYFKRENNGKEWILTPLAEGAVLKPGDEVEVQISIRTKHAAEYVHLRDPRAAGLEPDAAVSRYKWDLGISWYEEIRDSGTNFFFEWLPAGQYTFKYRVRANLGGTFRVGPATLQSMYAPEFSAYSAGHVIKVGTASAQ